MLAPDDANAAIGKDHTAAQQGQRVHAADPGKAQEPLLVHMADDHADLVHVRGEHDSAALHTFLRYSAPLSRGGPTLLQSNQVAQGIHAHLIHVPADVLLDCFAHGIFVARWAVGFSQFLDQLFHW